jgi:phage repressor protein C with HTH and peptisase S24 domain
VRESAVPPVRSPFSHFHAALQAFPTGGRPSAAGPGLGEAGIARRGGARLNEDHIEAIAKALELRLWEEQAPIPVRITYSRKFRDEDLPRERETDYFSVPIVEPRVAAGNPETVATEQVIDIVFIHRRALMRRSVRDYICTYVRGDSMEPVLRDGAIVCIDTKARPEGGRVPRDSIWAVRKDDGAVVKRIQLQDDRILLISENPRYDIETVPDGDAVIGRVVGVWQALA